MPKLSSAPTAERNISSMEMAGFGKLIGALGKAKSAKLVAPLKAVAVSPALIPPYHAASITATRNRDKGGELSTSFNTNVTTAAQTVAPIATEYPLLSNRLTPTR